MSPVYRDVDDCWSDDGDKFDNEVSHAEGSMIRTLTILILSITQVLSGPGCGGYLCIDKDGTYCGVDFGAEHCDCCADSAESADSHSETKCCGHSYDRQCCAVAGNLAISEDEDSDGHSDSNGVISHEPLPCSCIHVPVNAPAAKIEHGLESGPLNSCEKPVSHFSDTESARNADPGYCVLESRSPQTPHFSVLLHRCVVIRC
jgi:hypothetical protein